MAHAHFVRWMGPADIGVLLGVKPVADQTARRLPAAARIAHASMLAEVGPRQTDLIGTEPTSEQAERALAQRALALRDALGSLAR